jgi:formimidoylglutamate deiminase
MNLFAERALLPDGWADDVLLTIDGQGRIASVAPGGERGDAERAPGAVVPGMPNVHSHAFQRGIAGRTGGVSAAGDDSFWSWREAMYAFVDRVEPETFAAIAAQAYVEMVKAGYTAVAEFHYVHHHRDGHPYADAAELAGRAIEAADEAGIALTLLPVFYAHAGFGGQPAMPAQRRFVQTPDTYAALVAALAPRATAHGVRLGIAPHSLRAVTADELRAILPLAAAEAPVHIHAAEQVREVADCVAFCGQRPVEWLLANAALDRRWCVVHATHMNAQEINGLAASGAVAGVAPTTEADLGDGIFPGVEFVQAGGRFGVGSDSNAIVDPFAELRALEWSQRLRFLARNRLSPGKGTIGTALWAHAARHGADAVGRAAGAIAAGRRADLVVLDGDDATLASAPRDASLDAAIFGPVRSPVRDVMVGGRWVVRDGRHPAEEQVAARYRSAMAQLWAR